MSVKSIVGRSALLVALTWGVYQLATPTALAQFFVANDDTALADKCNIEVADAQARLAICAAEAVRPGASETASRPSARAGRVVGSRNRALEPAECANQYADELARIREEFIWEKGLVPELCGFEEDGRSVLELFGALVARFFSDGPANGGAGLELQLKVESLNDALVAEPTTRKAWPAAVQLALESGEEEQGASLTSLAAGISTTASLPPGISSSACYCDSAIDAESGWCMPPNSINADNYPTALCYQKDLCEVTTIDNVGFDAGEARTGTLFTDSNGRLYCNRGSYTASFYDWCDNAAVGVAINLSVPVCEFDTAQCLSPIPAMISFSQNSNVGGIEYSTIEFPLLNPNFPYGPAATGNTMEPGETLLNSIESSSSEYTLIFEANANLVLYRNMNGTEQVWWQSGVNIVTSAAIGGTGTTIMQADGNFVTYGRRGGTSGVEAVFSSNTGGNPNSYLVVEDDGYAAVYSPEGTRLWSTKTGPEATGDTMQPGEMLYRSIESANGLYTLVYQDDGNLVLYPNGSTNALWASGTQGTSQGSAIMQTDGNLVVYDQSGSPVFATNTEGNPGSSLVLENDGNVVIYAPDETVLWETNTGQ